MIDHLDICTTAPLSMAMFLAAHAGHLNRRPPDFKALVNAAMQSDVWRCRHDGCYPKDRDKRLAMYARNDQYDADFFLALGEALMYAETHFDSFNLAARPVYDAVSRDIATAPMSARLAYMLRGAFNTHRFGFAF